MIKKIFLGIAIVLVAIQFIGTDKNNANTYEVDTFISETKPSANIQNILKLKCYDCHSNKTNYPWYSNIVPISIWTNNHVQEGKEHLNFSNWSNYNTQQKIHKLNELIEEVEEGEMPLESYEILHGDLSISEKEALIDWAVKAITVY